MVITSMPLKLQCGLTPKDIRVGALWASLDRGWRWQPVFREFVKLFPNTVFFTGIWPGYIRGCEGTFQVRQLRAIKVFFTSHSALGYRRGFVWASPLMLYHLLRFRPEVILTNGFSLCTLYGLMLKALLRSRLILLWQGISSETLGGWLRLRVRQIMARFFDLTICNTREGVEYLQNLIGIPPSKLLHGTFEVADRDALCARESKENILGSTDHPVFLFVGRLIREKGVHKLLEASSLLVQRGLNCFSVVLVGKGFHEEEMRQFARTLGIENRVRWEGFVPYEALGAYYQACDVFILPSLQDTWGVVVEEAMAFGKPVLCSRYAGSKKVVEDGVNGFVFDADNPEELADYMARFIRDPGLIAKFGSASKELSQQYTPQSAARVLARAVASVLDSESATPAAPAAQKSGSSDNAVQEPRDF